MVNANCRRDTVSASSKATSWILWLLLHHDNVSSSGPRADGVLNLLALPVSGREALFGDGGWRHGSGHREIGRGGAENRVKVPDLQRNDYKRGAEDGQV